MKFAKTLQAESHHAWDGRYLDYKMMKKVLKTDGLGGVELFCDTLASELLKIRSFMRDQQEGIGQRICPLSALAVIQSTALDGDCQQLVQIIQQFRDYASLNATALRKIIKKFDKRFQTNFLEKFGTPPTQHMLVSHSEVGAWLLDPAQHCLQLIRCSMIGESVGAALKERHMRQLNFWFAELQAGERLMKMKVNTGATPLNIPFRLSMQGRQCITNTNTFAEETSPTGAARRSSSLPPHTGNSDWMDVCDEESHQPSSDQEESESEEESGRTWAGYRAGVASRTPSPEIVYRYAARREPATITYQGQGGLAQMAPRTGPGPGPAGNEVTGYPAHGLRPSGGWQVVGPFFIPVFAAAPDAHGLWERGNASPISSAANSAVPVLSVPAFDNQLPKGGGADLTTRLVLPSSAMACEADEDGEVTPKYASSALCGWAGGCRDDALGASAAPAKPTKDAQVSPTTSSASTDSTPPSWSLGSAGHPDSCGGLACKYAVKARGCKDGADCTRCHLCVWKAGIKPRGPKHRRGPAAPRLAPAAAAAPAAPAALAA